MARIRTIKPEFWDSPSTAKAGPWARLLFIAMWNWADDFGRGKANLKELEGFAFPNDSVFTDCSGNTVQFHCIVAEVSECFDVVFYEVDSRPFYAILSWDEHQRNERRAKTSKYPEPPANTGKDLGGAEIPCIVAEIPHTSGLGTGEQGNRGTEIYLDESSRPILREDVESMLDFLDARVIANGAKKPGRNKSNRDSMRLLIDKDGRDHQTIRNVIEFATSDDFWKSNVLSARALRKYFDRLLIQAQRPRTQDRATQTFLSDAARYAQMEAEFDSPPGIEGGQFLVEDH